MKKFLLIFLFMLNPLVFAAQEAVVTTDGAMVYRKGNFDSQVIGYLRSGQKVRVSSKIFGGAFYKVQFKQGVLGYIADTDIEVSGKTQAASRTAKKEIKNKSFIGKSSLGRRFRRFEQKFQRNSERNCVIFKFKRFI